MVLTSCLMKASDTFANSFLSYNVRSTTLNVVSSDWRTMNVMAYLNIHAFQMSSLYNNS